VGGEILEEVDESGIDCAAQRVLLLQSGGRLLAEGIDEEELVEGDCLFEDWQGHLVILAD
jgi:hypothetical protein